MSQPMVRRVVTIASWLLVMIFAGAAVETTSGGALGGWRRRAVRLIGASGGAAAHSAALEAPVRTMQPGARPSAAAGDRGATFYALEGQTTKLVTRFEDGTTATGERGFDGDLLTRLRDRNGNEVHRFKVDRLDDNTAAAEFVPAAGSPIFAQLARGVRTTLHWANVQSHKLFQDAVAGGTPLQWRNGFMRRTGAEPASADPDEGVAMIETVWANGLSARTARVHAKAGDRLDGKPVAGDTLVTEIRRDGVPIGTANYFTSERLFAWKLSGVADGWISAEHLKPRHGGWPFTPDMVWMNLQTLALYQWKQTIEANGFVAQNGCGARSESIGRRVTNFFVPTVLANEAGCDGLHWLDGSVFRYCCDVHDLCYQKAGCSASSWWQWWSSWRCDACNGWAAWCFVSGGGSHVLYPFP